MTMTVLARPASFLYTVPMNRRLWALAPSLLGEQLASRPEEFPYNTVAPRCGSERDNLNKAFRFLGTTNWSETPEQVRMTHQRRHTSEQK